MSLHASGTQKRPARPALVIDGEAIFVSRRPLGRAPPAGPSSSSARSSETSSPVSQMPEKRLPRQHEAPAAFGRRPTHRRPPAADLVFQGARARSLDEPASVPPRRDGLSVFTAVADFGGRTRHRRAAGLAGIFAVLALPLLVLSAPIGEAEATPGGGALVLDDLATSIAPRGAGAVLTVSGRIRNISDQTAPVPPLRIALAEPGGLLRSKSLVIGMSTLRAGRDLRFHSSVAVAKDTRGKIEVNLIATGLTGKTRFE